MLGEEAGGEAEEGSNRKQPAENSQFKRNKITCPLITEFELYGRILQNLEKLHFSIFSHQLHIKKQQ